LNGPVCWPAIERKTYIFENSICAVVFKTPSIGRERNTKNAKGKDKRWAQENAEVTSNIEHGKEVRTDFGQRPERS
jgi:hypothetical protein